MRTSRPNTSRYAVSAGMSGADVVTFITGDTDGKLPQPVDGGVTAAQEPHHE